MKKRWIGGLLLLAVIGASAVAIRRYIRHRRCAVKMETVYAYRLPSGSIFIEEDFQNPRLQKYRREEHLDDVVRPYQNDFDRILALAQWASRQFQAGTPFPHYPPWNARVILDRIRHGKTGGFCAQYAFVFGQACQSMGYIPRYLDLAAPENEGGHFTTEVYVPSLKKWVVFEAEWGMYYTDDQHTPLSAVELHAWAVGQRKDGLHEMPKRVHDDPKWVRLFYYFRHYLRNNFLTVPVFVRNDANQMSFEPYRLIWKDAYTSATARFLADAIPSSNAGDFQYILRTDSIPEVTWHEDGDFFKALTELPVYNPCKIHIPHSKLLTLVQRDLIHDISYHRLKSS